MDRNTPGFPVHHQLLEPTQTQVHCNGDAIQPSHPLSSPSPPAFNLSQHQGLFQSQFFTSGGQSIGVSASASVLPMNNQDWFPLGWTGWISLPAKGLSKVFINSWALSFLYSPTLTSIHDYWKNHSFRTIGVDKGNWGGSWFRKPHWLGQWLSKCGPQISNTSTAWELVKRADSQAPHCETVKTSTMTGTLN